MTSLKSQLTGIVYPKETHKLTQKVGFFIAHYGVYIGDYKPMCC